MQTIGEIALKEIENIKDKPVQITGGGMFNQHLNVERINKYLRGEFWECNDPYATFWQLSTGRVPLYAKSIDLDTKNFEMYGVGKFNYFKAFIGNARFKQWAREGELATILDDTSTGIGNYGSMVWKKFYNASNKVELAVANLENLYFDATVKNIIDSPVNEIHYWTESKIRSMYPDKADEIIEKATQGRDEDNNQAETEDDKFKIYERWGEFKEEEEDKSKYYHWIGTGSGDNGVDIVKDEIKIVDGKPKEFPYFDFHGERVPGRWQGLGVVERLFGLTEDANTLVNHNNKNNEIASLLLFQTSDDTTYGNILDNAKSGQIINSTDMREMGIDNRFISTFINQLQLIEAQADKLCFITDSISGDTPPSGVPFRSLAVATRGSASTFNYIKKHIGEKMGTVLQYEIMPDVVKDFGKEDIYNIMEDDIDIRLYDQMKIEDGIKKFMKKRAKEGKTIVFTDELQAETQRLQTELERGGRQEKVDIDFKWGIRMDVTGESVDKNTKNAAVDSIIEVMSVNPAIINTPIMQQKMEANGISPFRITPAEQVNLEQSQGPGLPTPPAQDKLSQLAAV